MGSDHDFRNGLLLDFYRRHLPRDSRLRYFKEGESEPYRTVSAPRRFMVELNGHVLPTRMTVHNYTRGTTTEVTFENLKVNPPIDQRVFSLVALEQERKLPD